MPDATPGPHPSVVIAIALGTETHKIDREALAAYRAGKFKKAETIQEEADEALAPPPAPKADEKK